MLVATFGPSTGWVGKTIEFDDNQFVLEGHGPIAARDILEYDRLGQITWAYDGLREWIGQLAAIDARPVLEPQSGLSHQSGRGDFGVGDNLSDGTERPDVPAVAPASGAPQAVEQAELDALQMPESRVCKTLRVITGIMLGLATLLSIAFIADQAQIPERRFVWFVAVAALVVLAAMLVLGSRLRANPRVALPWLKVGTSTLVVLAGLAFTVRAWLLSPLITLPAAGAEALANVAILWILASGLAVVTVLIHDREPLASAADHTRVSWRLRWPKWMWVPCIVLLLLGSSFVLTLLLLGTFAAYLLVWCGRRLETADGPRLRWPGRGWPAAAGVVGVVLAAIVLLGGPQQFSAAVKTLEAAPETPPLPSGLGLAPEEGKTVDYTNDEYGFAISYPSSFLQPADRATVLGSLKELFGDQPLFLFANDDSTCVVAIAATRKPIARDVREASPAAYKRGAKMMGRALEQQVPGATVVSTGSAKIGGLNGFHVIWQHNDNEYNDYHLYGRNIVFDLVSWRPLSGSPDDAAKLGAVLKSFRRSASEQAP